MQADAVVILCHPPEEHDYLMEQYVARSRAKQILLVIKVEKADDLGGLQCADLLSLRGG